MHQLKLSPSAEMFNRLKWLPLCEEVKVIKCALAFQQINGETALYISEVLKLNSEVHSRNIRYADINFIQLSEIYKKNGVRTDIQCHHNSTVE